MSKNKVFLWLLVVALAGVAVFSAIEGTQAFPVTLSQIDESTAQNLNVIFDMSEKEMLLPGVSIEKTVTAKNTGNVPVWLWYTFAIPDAWAPYIAVSCTAPGWSLSQNMESKNGFTSYTVFYNGMIDANGTTGGTLTLLLSEDVEFLHGSCYFMNGDAKVKIADSANIVTAVEVVAFQCADEIDSVEDAYDAHIATTVAD